MKSQLCFLLLLGIFVHFTGYCAKLFIPMDAVQKNHLKAYGIAYAAIAGGNKVEWLLNYQGGSFVMEYTPLLDTLCRQRGVTRKRMATGEYTAAIKKIKAPAFNGDVITLDKAPRIAVYTPPGKKLWDDAVTLGLSYAEIPFDKLYIDEVLADTLPKYDWLHLHHEDFTGQYGKFWTLFRDFMWYKLDTKSAKKKAERHGFSKVSQMQLAIAKKIRDFVAGGGNLFAMCSATDSYDIALAAEGVDICDSPYDGDPMDPNAQSKLDFSKCFAFTGFMISTNKDEFKIGNIDNADAHLPEDDEGVDFFYLQTFPAKFDPVPAMLCQNHTKKIKGFLGQTASFLNTTLKPDVIVMADAKEFNEARYIHGSYKAGAWTFYGGHDPEDYRHTIGSPPTDLKLYPNSPGYRLILNNVLCNASGKKDIAPVVCCDLLVSKPVIKTEVPVAATPPPATMPIDFIKIASGTSANTLLIRVTGADSLTKKIERVTFINSAGKEVFNKQYNNSSINIDMEPLPAGLYSIKVNGGYAGKVVKN